MLNRVIKAMETISPLALSESWDNTGLLVEAPIKRIGKKVMLTIDLTKQVMQEAVDDPEVSVIIAYHPVIFKPIKKLGEQPFLMACQTGISIYCPHTALDNCVGGINDWLAKG